MTPDVSDRKYLPLHPVSVIQSLVPVAALRCHYFVAQSPMTLSSPCICKSYHTRQSMGPNIGVTVMVIAQIKEMIDEKLKAQAEKFLLECQNGFKVRSCIGPLFGMKLLGGGGV